MRPDSGTLSSAQWFSLLNVARRLTRERDLYVLLNRIVQDTSEMLEAERSTLFLYDDEVDELWSFVAEDAEVKEIRLPLGEGIAGEVARTRRLLNVNDAYESELFNREVDRLTGYRTRNVLAAPMLNPDDELVGVLQSLNRRGGAFAREDEMVLEALASVAASAIENTKLHDELQQLLRDVRRTLAAAIDAKDPVTAGHSERVTFYAVKLGEAAGLTRDELRTLEFAAGLHDVGKIGVQDAILSKPARLTEEEYTTLKSHATHTQDILNEIHYPRAMREIPLIAASHHERVDGEGYPDGLQGDEFPLLARILAIADVYDALVAYDRPYKPAIPTEEALQTIQEGAGTQFDPDLVKLFREHKCYDLDRRTHLRVTGEVTIDYELMRRDEEAKLVEAEKAGSTLSNLGGGGISFVAPHSLPPGDHLRMSIHMPDLDIHMIGRVLRCEPVGPTGNAKIAVKFVNLSDPVQGKLGDYLVNLVHSRPEIMRAHD